MAPDLRLLRADLWVWRVLAGATWQAGSLLLASLLGNLFASFTFFPAWSLQNSISALGSSVFGTFLQEALQIPAVLSHTLILTACLPEPSLKLCPAPAGSSRFGPATTRNEKYNSRLAIAMAGCLISAAFSVSHQCWLAEPVQPQGQHEHGQVCSLPEAP